MSEKASMILEAETPLSPAELQVLKKQFEREGEYVTTQTKFNYAWGLVKSRQSDQIALALTLLTEIYTECPNRRRECLYYLALGHYKISNFNEARQFNSQLLKLEPRNEQALELQRLIDEKLSREGVIGLAIISSVVAVGAALVATIIKRK
ncbi:mitochondria fission 1 protein [Phycomyces blakesleeanus]|uniref:Mitochondrial fission 1 protein n=2 Tax=Phycomyces blakesleeanus TaxID=4837 RepID=A0A167KZG7_PHYB8|nr:hypothetical protein PHYBLDRAFT_188394 [Phycomyces blakesleeanus NRRL 1555(-)]OAD69228.1 hypothetical protein PHYBLDRAFT_188394 [Phycomyces blakesleeanus NRRL 1555(-)]|eukprot:XP_018287268.1 hypothetical protein PHYBLDRAFT_188394 [Phycomyces blakesleeanus NRRL 1555(-)]